jgi:hypothetical protein
VQSFVAVVALMGTGCTGGGNASANSDNLTCHNNGGLPFRDTSVRRPRSLAPATTTYSPNGWAIVCHTLIAHAPHVRAADWP